MNANDFLRQLAAMPAGKFHIVSSGSMDELSIAISRSCGVFYVDEEMLGYAIRPMPAAPDAEPERAVESTNEEIAAWNRRDKATGPISKFVGEFAVGPPNMQQVYDSIRPDEWAGATPESVSGPEPTTRELSAAANAHEDGRTAHLTEIALPPRIEPQGTEQPEPIDLVTAAAVVSAEATHMPASADPRVVDRVSAMVPWDSIRVLRAALRAALASRGGAQPAGMTEALTEWEATFPVGEVATIRELKAARNGFREGWRRAMSSPAGEAT